jgi:hypothetical protein
MVSTVGADLVGVALGVAALVPTMAAAILATWLAVVVWREL